MAPDPKIYGDFKDEEILAFSLERPSAFGALVDRYQNPFLRTALKIVNQKEEAEDIVQESFTKIYLNAKRFKQREGASFKSWAYKIVINTSLTHYKKLKRIKETTEYINPLLYNEIPDSNISVESSLDMEILLSRILPEMPNHLQESLKKYYLKDRSQKDIAEEERVSITTIKMRLFRARKLFKKLLEENKKPLWTL